MDNNKQRILTIAAGVIGLIGVFFMAIESGASQGIVSWFVSFAVALLVIVTIITILLSVFNLVKNPQNLKKTLIGLGILVAILAITHFTASDDLATGALGEVIEIKDTSGKILTGDEAKSVTKWVAGLITFTGILGAAGLGVIGFGMIKNLSK